MRPRFSSRRMERERSPSQDRSEGAPEWRETTLLWGLPRCSRDLKMNAAPEELLPGRKTSHQTIDWKMHSERLARFACRNGFPNRGKRGAIIVCCCSVLV